MKIKKVLNLIIVLLIFIIGFDWIYSFLPRIASYILGILFILSVVFDLYITYTEVKKNRHLKE